MEIFNSISTWQSNVRTFPTKKKRKIKLLDSGLCFRNIYHKTGIRSRASIQFHEIFGPKFTKQKLDFTKASI